MIHNILIKNNEDVFQVAKSPNCSTPCKLVKTKEQINYCSPRGCCHGDIAVGCYWQHLLFCLCFTSVGEKDRNEYLRTSLWDNNQRQIPES